MDNLDQATQSLPVSDARINSLDAEYFGTWTFSTLVRGDEWNPALFTDVLKDCAPKLGTTLQKAKIAKALAWYGKVSCISCEWAA